MKNSLIFMLLISLVIISITSISGADNSTGDLDLMIDNESATVADNVSVNLNNNSSMGVSEDNGFNLEGNIVENNSSKAETFPLNTSSINETTVNDEDGNTDEIDVLKLGSNISNNTIIPDNTSIKSDEILKDENPVTYYVS